VAAKHREMRGVSLPPGERAGGTGYALAYAHINADGSLDGPNSLAHPLGGQHCLKVSSSPHNVVVTPTIGTGGITIADTQGTPYVT
jgi:hypothetical protein